MKKNGLFRPAGGEMSFHVSNCVTPVILQNLHGAAGSILVPDLNARFACGSMVLFYLFHTIFALCAKIV